MDDIGRSLQICTGCGEAKEITGFDLRADTGKRRAKCKDCRRKYQVGRWLWSVNPERSSRVVGTRELFPCRGRCKELKPADAFNRRGPGSDRLHSWCKECFAVYKAERHIRLHDREMARIRRNQKVYVARNVERLREYLAIHPCVDCGESDPIVLDFDHIRDKACDVSHLVYHGHPWERILEEIAKCQVRCANDHRRATYARRIAAQRTEKRELRREPA